MADDVQVTVGLSLQNLQSGVAQAARSLDTLKSSMQALAGYFAVREIAEFVSKMTELGEKTERTAAILGVSAETTQQLAAMSQLAGGSGDELAVSLTRLQVGLQRGQNLTGAQAAAFKALGVNAKELANVPVDKQILVIADAVKKLDDNGKNAAPALALISRGLANMMPYLVGGSAEILKWQQRVKEVGGVLSNETNRALADTQKEFTLLGIAMEKLGQTIVATNTWIKSLATELSTAAGNMTLLISSGNLMNYIMGWMANYADLLGANLVKLAIIFANLGAAMVGGIKWSEVFTKDLEQANAAAAEATAELRRLNEEFEKTKKGILEGLGSGGGKPGVSVDLGLGKAQKDQLKVAEEQYQWQVEHQKLLVDTFQITETQKTNALKAALLTRMNAEIAAGEATVVAQAKYAAAVEKLNDEAAKKATDAWKKFADQFASDFSNALNQVLQGQKSFSAAMGEMFGKMIEQMIASIVKLIAEYVILNAAAALFDILTGGSGVAFGTTINAGATAGASGPSMGGLFSKLLGLDVGTPYVQTSGLAMIHQGEAVIPAQANPFAAGQGGGMGGNLNFTVQALDAQSFNSWLRGGGGAMLSRYMSQAWQANPSMRPGYTA